MNFNINDFTVNTIILSICVIIGMISGDITRGVYLEYSKYNIYVEVKKAVQDSKSKAGSLDVKKTSIKKKLRSAPPKPSIVSKRLFAILKDPFRNRKNLMIFGEKKEKPAPLIYRILGIKWKGSEKSRELDSEIDRIEALSEIIKEIKDSNDKFLEQEESNAVQEYLRKKVSELKKEQAEVK